MGKPRTPPGGLKPKEAKFAAEYLKDGDAQRAALAVDPTYKDPGTSGSKMLQKPAVREVVKAAHQEIAKKGVHNLEIAMQEAKDAMDFAKETANANAFIKAVEHRAKLNGLLVEKIDVRAQGFILNIVGLAPPEQVADAIEEQLSNDDPKEPTEDDLIG